MSKVSLATSEAACPYESIGARSNGGVASDSKGLSLQTESVSESSSNESSSSPNGNPPNGFLRPGDGPDNGSSADDDDGHLTGSSRNNDDDDPMPPPLEHRIRESMIPSAGSHQHEKFLPICDLEEIITFPNIIGELKRSRRVKSDLDVIARQVLESPAGKATSCRRIFAILCLLRKTPKIQEFIKEGYFDCDLPFDFQDQEGSNLNEGSNAAPNLFKSWKPYHIDGFDTYQGQLSAPFFTLSNDNRLTFSEQKLHHSVVLPFVEYEVKDRTLGKTVQGGFSEVRIVKIHRAHHDYLSADSVDDVYFAVKQLQKVDDTSLTADHERILEVQAYKRLNQVQHPHLTRLLATYTHRKHLHLIFPYATGDLHNFWYDHFPKPTAPLRDHKFVRWISRQLLGLAQALYKIHHCDVHESAAQHASIDAAKTHGRHGDLKPENILWFQHESNESEDGSFGMLKISDFGFAEFHSPLSLSVETTGVGGITPTYKAPEFEMNRISPKYDIWSFGCILLQFIVWYLHGWDGVEKFSRKRMHESNRLAQLDDFFNFHNMDNMDEILVTEAKKSVRKEISSIRNHPASSDFILDLVDFIESKLLRMSAKNRTTCDEAKRKLEELDGFCRESIEYCTQKRRPLTKTATDLSDRIEVNLSAKTRREIIETIDPASPKLPEEPDESETGSFTPKSIERETNVSTEKSTERDAVSYTASLSQEQDRDPMVGLGIVDARSEHPVNFTDHSTSGIEDPVTTDETAVSPAVSESVVDIPYSQGRFRTRMKKLLPCFA